ncbi:ABC transporter ATP-binding protein [Tepiditoga spiralis]|uniref:ABC transporter ATP-binding protein n=1 Tax=Tepiditoga spiralis TaxID=2108365 RepID=A0A7G1G5E9_9BACT|nr:ABC transporter ATP-binding protein [Tepiditoga spiralis]BBE30117.1 ABC transporter ATP-binding protein [Tepiditoga spiralis]
MIVTENLKKIYNTGDLEVDALNGINLKIEEGKIVSILGPSGSGKSTLLNCLSGIDRPTEGKIKVAGIEITELKDNELTSFRSKNMGFIFQSYNLIPVLNSVENVELPLLINGENEKTSRKKALEMLQQVGLSKRSKSFPSMLSGGESQRVAIARALVTTPKIVWADEPTGALDTKTSMEIMNLIVKLNKENAQTFVIVTHDIRITEYSSKIFEMDSGKIISER